MFKSRKKAFEKKAIELQKQLDQNYLKEEQKGQGLDLDHYKKVLEANPGRRAAYDRKVSEYTTDFVVTSSNHAFRSCAQVALKENRCQEFIDMLMEQYVIDPTNLKSAIGLRMYNRFIEDFL